MADGEVTFDWDDLTIEEVEIIEEITGVSIDSLQKEGTPQGKTLRAIVYIVKRREDPSFTREDAGRMNVAAVGALMKGIGAGPTPAVS